MPPKTLPDFLFPRPRLLVVGLNPASYAVGVGHYYARRSNRFWRLLFDSGLTPRLLVREEDARLPEFGIALTDLVKRPSPNMDDVAPDEFRAARARLLRIARRLQPGVIAFNGLTGYRFAFDPKAQIGLQPLRVADRPVFIAPSSSARAGATFTYAQLLERWRALAALVTSEAASAGRSPRSPRPARRSPS